MQRVGPYEVLQELGRGGMGVVYRARKAGSPGREVALKVLLAPLADPEELARFERETRALGSLRHPGIIAVHDAGVSAERYPYLALALMTGGSLQDRLRQQGALEPRRAAEITRKLAQAVAYSHQQGVLHRDLKPHNVLFNEDGEPVVTDFGLARMTHRDERITATGEVLGTPAYMSPEQAEGERARIGPHSDVYGLGATLYAMLSGDPPFRAGSLMGVLSKVVSEPPDPLSREIDPDLAVICFRCLEKEPGDRYPDAAGLGRALGAWLAGGREPTRRAPLIGVVAGVLLLIAAGVAIALGSGSSEELGDEPNTADRARSVGAVETAIAVIPTAEQPEPTSSPVDLPNMRAAFKRAEQAGDWQGALAIADRAVQQERRSETVHARATALWNLGRQEAALREMAAAVELSPRNAGMRKELATMLQKQGDTSASWRELDRAWELDPGVFSSRDTEALIGRRSEERRFAEGLAVIEHALNAEPDRLEVQLARCVMLWELWKRAEAIKGVQALLLKLPGASPRAPIEEAVRHHEGRFSRDEAETAARGKPSPELSALRREAEACLERGDYRGVLAVCQRATKIRRVPLFLCLASRCFAKLGDGVKAEKAAREALRFSASSLNASRAAWLVANAYVLQGRLREAEHYLNQAIDLNPRFVRAFGYRGAIRFDLGDHARAFADSRRALELQPAESLGLVMAGWERYYAGDYTGALAWFERLLREPRTRSSALARAGRAAALIKLQRVQDAEQVLNELLAQVPKQYRARIMRAEIRWKRGEKRAAIADLSAGLEAMPRGRAEYEPRRRLLQKWLSEAGGR